MTISAVSQLARGFAAKIADDKHFAETINTAIQAGEANKKSPYNFYLDMRRVHGKELDTFPIPGTSAELNDPKHPHSNNPDRYEVLATDGQTKIKGSFSQDYADSLPIAVSILKVLTEIKEETGNFTPSKMKAGQLKKEKNKFSARLQTIRSNVKTAINFHHKFEAVNAMQGVEAEITQEEMLDDNEQVVKDAKGQPVMQYADAVEPIAVHDTKRKGFSRFFSVKGFLKLDVDAANEAGGGWERLIATLEREPQTPENDNSNQVNVSNMAQYNNAVAALNTFFEGLKATDKGLPRLLKDLRGAGSEPLLEGMFDLYEHLSIVTEAPEFKRRYDEITLGEKKAAA
jgi:hypothetical protein